jgi:hypothetical protein
MQLGYAPTMMQNCIPFHLLCHITFVVNKKNPLAKKNPQRDFISDEHYAPQAQACPLITKICEKYMSL